MGKKYNWFKGCYTKINYYTRHQNQFITISDRKQNKKKKKNCI